MKGAMKVMPKKVGIAACPAGEAMNAAGASTGGSLNNRLTLLKKALPTVGRRSKERCIDVRELRSESLIFILSMLFLFVSGCSEKVAENFMGSGTLEAKEVRVGALVTGKILRLGFEEGETVGKGDTLAVIDIENMVLKKREIMANFDEIEASRKAAKEDVSRALENLSNVEKRYRRIKGLFEKGSATEQQMDDISSQLAIAKSRLKSAEAKLETLEAKRKELEASVELIDKQIRDGVLVAPIDGIVAQKYFEEGEIVRVSAPIYKLVDTGDFWLRIFVAETELAETALGDTVEVRVDGIDDPLEGVVAWVSTEAEFTPKNVQTKNERAELVYAVKVRILGENRFLKIGMPAEVYSR